MFPKGYCEMEFYLEGNSSTNPVDAILLVNGNSSTAIIDSTKELIVVAGPTVFIQ